MSSLPQPTQMLLLQKEPSMWADEQADLFQFVIFDFADHYKIAQDIPQV